MVDLPRITLTPAVPATGASGGTRTIALGQLALGQLLEATVLRVRPASVPGAANTVHIGMAGRTLTASTSVTLNPGDQLTLRVERTDRQPTFSVVARKAMPLTAPASAISAALRADLPRQSTLATALNPLVVRATETASRRETRALTNPSTAVRTGASPPATGQSGFPDASPRLTRAFEVLKATLPTRAEVTNPATLATQLIRSGVLLEAVLERASPTQPPTARSTGTASVIPPSNTAGSLSTPPASRATANTAGGAPAVGAAATNFSAPPFLQAHLQRDLKANLNRIRAIANADVREGEPSARRAVELIDSALSRIRVLQIATFGGFEDSSNLKLATELPVVGPGATLESIEFRIEAEAEKDPNRQGEKDETTWQVTVRLDLPTLGLIEAVVGLKDGAVSTHFRLKSPETASVFEEALPELATRLHSAGLAVDSLSAETGTSTPSDTVRTANHLVHVVI